MILHRRTRRIRRRGQPGGWKVACLLVLLTGCGKPGLPGNRDVPPGLPAPTVYADVNPRWSHDGTQVAFVRSTPDRQKQLYVVDDGLERPLALLEPELLSPDRGYRCDLRNYCSGDSLAWSPDDAQIAFERTDWFTFDDGERLPGTSLWALTLKSGHAYPLALHPTRYESRYYFYHTPQWSLDGRYIAFVGEGINGQRVIGVRPLTPDNAQKVVPRFDTFDDSDWPVWQPLAGLHPALWYRQSIRRSYAVAPTETWRCLRSGEADASHSGEQWRIRAASYSGQVPHPTPGQPVIPRIGQPVWSSDGRKLAFTLTPDPNDWQRYEIWVYDTQSRTARRISSQDGRGYFAPVWISRDRLGALSPEGGKYAVVVLDLASGAKKVLGTIESADCDWSPDRSRIVYATHTAGGEDSDSPTTLRLFKTKLPARF